MTNINYYQQYNIILTIRFVFILTTYTKILLFYTLKVFIQALSKHNFHLEFIYKRYLLPYL